MMSLKFVVVEKKTLYTFTFLVESNKMSTPEVIYSFLISFFGFLAVFSLTRTTFTLIKVKETGKYKLSIEKLVASSSAIASSIALLILHLPSNDKIFSKRDTSSRLQL